jgi:hypothetical protein
MTLYIATCIVPIKEEKSSTGGVYMIEKYVKLSALQDYPIRINHYDRLNGKLDFVLGIESVIEYAEQIAVELPVPQPELG